MQNHKVDATAKTVIVLVFFSFFFLFFSPSKENRSLPILMEYSRRGLGFPLFRLLSLFFPFGKSLAVSRTGAVIFNFRLGALRKHQICNLVLVPPNTYSFSLLNLLFKPVLWNYTSTRGILIEDKDIYHYIRLEYLFRIREYHIRSILREKHRKKNSQVY